ncbi:MAG: glycoside hydrolase family 43 protein [Tepidisphaeraceae bacterium]
MAETGGFLFATFKGESLSNGEQVYFGVSRDGLKWGALNGAEPILTSEIGECGVRDPFIIRSNDGSKFWLLGTDLRVYTDRDWTRAVREGSRSILIWESSDLVNWSTPRLVALAPSDAGCAWAPECVYDVQRDEYLVFWASTTCSDDFQKHRIWASRTNDFVRFSEPTIYIERSNAVIDTTIVHERGRYYRFSKDESIKTIAAQSSEDLDGPWTELPTPDLAELRGYEGPQAFVLKPGVGEGPATWCLLLDQYAISAGYQPFVTRDLSGGRFESGGGFSFPFKFRHGSVIPITAEELRRLEAKWGR